MEISAALWALWLGKDFAFFLLGTTALWKSAPMIGDAVQQWVTVVQVTWNERLDQRLDAVRWHHDIDLTSGDELPAGSSHCHTRRPPAPVARPHRCLQASYRPGKTGKSGEWSGKGQGKTFFVKSGKMKNWCHQMSDFQAKMHQICSPLGLRPQTCWGCLKDSVVTLNIAR